MCTSIVLFALSGFLASAGGSDAPGWLQEYGKARQLGQKEDKPLAVFIGSGKAGWNQVSSEGRLGGQISQLLKDSFVCLYVNLDDESGQRLGQAFEMSSPGIVISTVSGQQQAFRHEGSIANDELASYLRRYADPDLNVRFTETVAARYSYYAPADQWSGYRYPSSFAPAFTGFTSGGC